MEKQKKLYQQATKNLKQRQEQAIRLSTKSHNVKEFIDTLDQNQVPSPSNKPIPSSIFSTGERFMPIAGSILVKYGEKDHLDADSQGWWIMGREKSLVVAPMEGVIQFVGNFKSYGNIVIIEHGKRFHSLIAGLNEINVFIDQHVSAGQPIGELHRSPQQNNPRLYYELRKAGKAIDPIEKLGKVINN